MAIGTSLGGFFNNEMEMHVAPFQEKDKGIQPETGLDTNDDNELPGNPGGMKTLEVGKKDMPFPNNVDPGNTFVNRFGDLPPNGILNDLKKPNPDQNMPLVRKINDYYDPNEGYTKFFNGIATNPDKEGFIKAPSQQSGRGIDGYDYDYKSFFEDNPDAKMSPGQHYPDTYKKPNHPTFSDESRYDNIPYLHPKTGEVTKAEGGHWDKSDDGKDTFIPGKSNLDFHSTQELMDYFKKNEPDAQLILPGQ